MLFRSHAATDREEDPRHVGVLGRIAVDAAALAEELPRARERPGVHGYSPEHPDMAGIFLAIGRGVPAGARPLAVRMIDVAPTVARLLGIDPPRDAEGRAIDAFGGS